MCLQSLLKYPEAINYYNKAILTNPSLEDFTEAKVILVTDPWPDKNAIQDAARIGIPVVALCDTNNEANSIDFVVPCNNKGKKSLGLFFWILARREKSEKKISIEIHVFSLWFHVFLLSFREHCCIWRLSNSKPNYTVRKLMPIN